jgi:hypothetical protein
MQSLLQVWYVGVAVFGFLRWSREGATRVSLLSCRGPRRRYCRIAAAGCGHAAQGLVFTAFLLLVYLVIASAGFIEWLKTYRRQTAA